ncbi:MAG: cobalt-zinc-cadmium efflux system protein [Bacteroidia bacterium]
MGQHHNHSSKNLKVAFFLNLGFTILEIFAGLYVNSIAIISDAVHDMGDSMSLGLSWYLDKKSKQKPDKKYSFGYARFSLLGAAINSIVIIASSVFVVTEAIKRLQHPEHSNANGMILFALVGIAVNGYAAWRLSGGKTLNEKVISWHLIEDVLGWVAILIVAIVLHFKDIPYLDPALSLLITLYILWNVFKRLKETTFLFLQGTPLDVDVAKIERKLKQAAYVENVHHTHVWSLEGEHHVFSTHVKLKEIASIDALSQVKTVLKEIVKAYGFKHVTIEVEFSDEDCLDEGET